jgi:hypothetical protein
MDFRVGNVMKIGVVLTGEGFEEGGRDQDARGEVGITVDLKTVAGGEGIGVDGVQARGVGELGGFPLLERRRKGGVAGGGEAGEQRGRAVQHLSEDLGEVGEFGDVANEPQEIGIQKHNFSTMLI